MNSLRSLEMWKLGCQEVIDTTWVFSEKLMKAHYPHFAIPQDTRRLNSALQELETKRDEPNIWRQCGNYIFFQTEEDRHFCEALTYLY